jgi:TonB-linked SusC/RagA family outer membrane protein
MERMLRGMRFCRHAGMSLLLALVVCGTALAQGIQVSGTVTTTKGVGLRGVTVHLRGTETRTVTEADGKYSLTAPSDGVLTYALIGYRGTAQTIGGRTSVNVVMDEAIPVLPEVVVTGYTSQRAADITGAVSSLNVESVQRQTSASVLQRLGGAVPGVTVDASGSPGSRSTVRIRGVGSFQNNDPLYIVDGTPVADSYINWLNPNDIGEVQVLKDASAASIYGSRAGNGVVIIQTKRGRPGPHHTVTLDVRSGVATPIRGLDDIVITDALQYYQFFKLRYQNAGLPVPTNIYGSDPNNPKVPAYIWPTCVTLPCPNDDPSLYSYPNNLIMPGSAGTDWWKAVFGAAQVREANLGISGGGEDNQYNVSFNYLNQQGTAAYNLFQRGTVRINTAFTMNKVSVGENIIVGRDQHYGGIPDDPGGYAEDGIIGKNMLMQPVIPVHDIAGYFASGKATNLGNQSNPLAYAWWRRDDRSTNDRLFGSVFGQLELNKRLGFKSTLGFNLGQSGFRGFTPTTPENAEVNSTNGITENNFQSTDWDWANTLTYAATFDRHTVNVLVGQAAYQGTTRFFTGSINGLLNVNVNSRYIQDALANASTKNVSSSGSIAKGLSFFGKADYNFASRYYVSLTVRRDGSSRFGPTHQWGTFPAFNVGWRLSQESFLQGNPFFSNIMLRFGYGVTGNQQIPSGRIVSQFGGGTGDTFYDIGGTGTTIVPGFRQTSLGNADLKWEENKSLNVGVDLDFLEGKGNFTVDVYRRNTDNLLFDPPNPATAGLAAPAIVNIGKMKNTGIDFALSYRGTLGEATVWSATLTGSHYKNSIVQIDGSHDFFYGPIATRFGNQIINQVGFPIGSFYGLVADGYFKDAADALAHTPAGGCGPNTAPCQDGAAPGRIKFKDVNGDGLISLADRTVIGSPHPDFTGGLDLSLRHGAWDVSITLFGTHGNKIFDVQKEFYVFDEFNNNVRKDLLTDSWTPTHQNAKYPIIDVNDVFSSQISSFYLEDGSYLRLRSLQIGYTFPPAWIRWIPTARVYLTAENLFTITGYPGLDPALPAANVFGPAGDIRDQYRGVDRGSYPASKTITVGISTTF